MSTESALRAALQAAWSRSDQIFGLLPDGALLERPISLRHPVLFYVGHLPAFSWNQVGRGALGLGDHDAELDALFERGIDPADEAQAQEQSIAAWPSLDRVHAYRDAVRERLLGLVEVVLARPEDPVCRGGRILHVALEHELMHQETLLYMLQHVPELLRRPAEARLHSSVGLSLAPREVVRVPGGPATVGVDRGQQAFHWDNEVPASVETLPAFSIDRLPVTNAQLWDFFAAGGYADDRLWTGSWRPAHPSGWTASGEHGGRPEGWTVRWMFGQAAFGDAALWPAQVALEEARAYARWQGRRLPTEAELNRAAYADPDSDRGGPLRSFPWGAAPPDAARTTADFTSWCPRPVGQTPAGASAWGIEELVGNGWEWTDTVWQARPGFVADLPSYPGYSADFFDGDHFVVFGGSWATDARLLRRSFRNWYQPRYPHVFSAFRLVG